MIIPAQEIRDVKTCSKCQGTFPATVEHFYRHPSGRFGLTPRCKPCVNEDNAAAKAKADPTHIKRLASERTKRHYWKSPEASRARMRDAAARARAVPEKRAKINMRKRGGAAGLTPEQFAEMLAAQGGKCAICYTTEPSTKAKSNGWNIDHCHKSGRVRFILCNNCNRGLGAFCDDPARMRRAADLLSQLEPVE